jgi:dihydroorotate dehydrogenase
MYTVFKSILFLLPPEIAHKIAMKGLKIILKIPILDLLFKRNYDQPVVFSGIQFKNRLGVAAGFDKNAEYI